MSSAGCLREREATTAREIGGSLGLSFRREGGRCWREERGAVGAWHLQEKREKVSLGFSRSSGTWGNGLQQSIKERVSNRNFEKIDQ